MVIVRCLMRLLSCLRRCMGLSLCWRGRVCWRSLRFWCIRLGWRIWLVFLFIWGCECLFCFKGKIFVDWVIGFISIIGLMGRYWLVLRLIMISIVRLRLRVGRIFWGREVWRSLCRLCMFWFSEVVWWWFWY